MWPGLPLAGDRGTEQVEALAAVRQWSGEVATIGGGFDSGLLGEDLLQALDGLDYVVTGDAELPLWQLLQARSFEHCQPHAPSIRPGGAQ